MGMRGGPRVQGSGHGRLLPPGCQPLLLPFMGISYRYIQRARMGLNSPPSPPPSFPAAAISDSRSQRVRFLPGHQHCPAQAGPFRNSAGCTGSAGWDGAAHTSGSSLEAGMLGHPLHLAAFMPSRFLPDLRGTEPLVTPV